MVVAEKYQEIFAGSIMLGIIGLAYYEPTRPLAFYLIVTVVVVILVVAGWQTYKANKRWQLFILQKINMPSPDNHIEGVWKSPTSDHCLEFTEKGTVKAASGSEKFRQVASYVVEGQTIKILKGSELFGFIDHKTRRSPFDIDGNTLTIYRQIDDTITFKKSN